MIGDPTTVANQSTKSLYQKLYILSLQIAEGLGPNLSFQSYFAQKKITGQIGQIYQYTYQTIAGIFANYSWDAALKNEIFLCVMVWKMFYDQAL